jgi:hypothetical protein
MRFGDLSSGGSSMSCQSIELKVTYLHFMLDSTLSRSLNPMPQGRPGVASSMNLPNSG